MIRHLGHSVKALRWVSPGKSIQGLKTPRYFTQRGTQSDPWRLPMSLIARIEKPLLLFAWTGRISDAPRIHQ